jgi:inorganic triphosphatase YgiF
MEIEAKFAVPDAETFRQLKSATHLGGFPLSAGKTGRVHDTYLDTRDHQIFAAGYAFRRRKQAGKILITLKELKTATDSIHRREELELALPDDLPPAQWQPSPVRDLALGIVGEKPLVPLFDLRQTRTLRAVTRAGRQVAELSLDQVRVVVGDRILKYFELECELLPEGTESDLAGIEICLREEWKLQPEPRSKFERALESISTTNANA